MKRAVIPGFRLASVALWLSLVLPVVAFAADPLPSWNDGPAKSAIVAFVDQVTAEGGKGYVAPPARIAVFDNDGTLWAEQPIYFQVAFAIDRIKALAPRHPEWKQKAPFRYILAGDLKAALAGGEKSIVELIAATHAGMTTDEFARIVSDWLATARHPVTHKPYTAMVYQPMLELLAYLRASGFKTFIVTGGGVEFVRPLAALVYGIPTEQVVGSSGNLAFAMEDGVPVIRKLAQVDFVNDGAGKPVDIQKYIGQRPIAAFGNSDGDRQMLEWTTMQPGPSFGLIVHHTDAAREWAYDRKSPIGTLDKALDEAPARGWIVVDMKKEWKVIYPP